MTEQTLELAMLLPREAECGKCVDEVGRELVRLDGVHAIEAAQLAADLVHALAALRLARQQYRQLEGLLRHRASTSAGSPSFGARAASPARPSVL